MKPKIAIEQASNFYIKTGIWILIIVTFLAYFNTFQNKYVLDDFGIATENSLTEKGIKGIPKIFLSGYRSTLNWNDHELYRPIPKAIFAILWNISPNNPALAHILLVLLYSITCGFLFYVLFSSLKLSLKLSFIASLLFALHPIHTEVVANIKGLEEVLAFLFLLLGCYFLLKGKETNLLNLKELLLINLSFLLALLSKESAISYLIIFPMVLYFFSEPTLKMVIKLIGSLTIVATIYLIFRWMILGENTEMPDITTNYLITIDDPLNRFANSIYISGIYLKQLIWPVTLLCEASFRHYQLIELSDYRFWFILLLLISAAVYAILKSKSKVKVAFGILFFLITFAPVSNVLLLIGTNYGERLVFVPSLGFCILLTLIIEQFVKGSIITKPEWLKNIGFRNQQIYFLFGILSFYFFRTYTRNENWKDPLTLFSADVETAPESARLQAYYANAVTDPNRLNKMKDNEEIQKEVKKGIAAYEKAIMINPKFDAAYESLGNLQFKTGDYANAEKYYLKAINLNTKQPYYQNNYGDFLFQQQRFEEAKIRFENAVLILPGFAKALNNLGSIHGSMGKTYLSKAEQSKLKNDTIDMNFNIKMANLKFDTAISYYDMAIESDPYFYEPIHYKAIIYSLKGDINMANMIEAKAEKLKADLAKSKK